MTGLDGEGLRMATRLDAAIVSVYRQFGTPADRIVADPAIGEQFAGQVNNLAAEGQPATLAEINKRLLNLRRRGEDQGGLPRLQRRYHGRNNPDRGSSS
jgi:hypothetical protein